MLPGEHRHAVGADLVGDVAVGGNPIGADHHEIDLPELHHRRGHVVGDHGGVDAVPDQLPRGEPRTLQERPRLVRQHRHLLATLRGGTNDAERGAVARRGQRAGVAVRQDARLLRHQLRAERAHRPAALDVLVVNAPRVRFEPLLDLVDRAAALRCCGEHPLHALDGPEQVDRRRPRRRHQVAQLLKLDGELLRAGRLAPPHPERDAHRRRDANRRRTPNDHRLDRPGDFLRGLAGDIDLRRRQLALVDHDDDVVFPLDGGEHGGGIFLAIRSAPAHPRHPRSPTCQIETTRI